MEPSSILLAILVVFFACDVEFTFGLSRHCFVCRSRGELGSCKDPFKANATSGTLEKGIETVPCASGWCGKILETENEFKEEYGVATQRMCLQRGPSDSEDRCAYTKWKHRRVLMCFCRGDLCNSSSTRTPILYTILAFSLYRLVRTLGSTTIFT